MSEQSRARIPVDFGDLERQLKEAAGSQPKAPVADPLAELARIVGQDDPFRSIFGKERTVETPKAPHLVPVQPAAPADAGRSEQSLDDLIRDLLKPPPPLQRKEPAVPAAPQAPVAAPQVQAPVHAPPVQPAPRPIAAPPAVKAPPPAAAAPDVAPPPQMTTPQVTAPQMTTPQQPPAHVPPPVAAVPRPVVAPPAPVAKAAPLQAPPPVQAAPVAQPAPYVPPQPPYVPPPALSEPEPPPAPTFEMAAPDPEPEPQPVAAPEPQAAPSFRRPADDLPTLDEFDRILRDELRGALPASDVEPELDFDADDRLGRGSAGYGAAATAGLAYALPQQQPAYPEDDYPEPPIDDSEDLRSLEPQAPRKGLLVAGALLGVAVLGVGAVVGLSGLGLGLGGTSGNGEVPVILAEPGPAKVPPQNPGGVEIPNQNKEIYVPSTAPAGESRVVNREEQPIDVQAATRNVARVILPGPGATSTDAAPTAPSADISAPITSAIPGLGEPRRVRTVAVRPDGTIAPLPTTPEAAPPAAPETTPPPAASAPPPANAVPPPASVVVSPSAVQVVPPPTALAEAPPATPAAPEPVDPPPQATIAPLPPVRGPAAEAARPQPRVETALANPPAARPAPPATEAPRTEAPREASRPAPAAPAPAAGGGGFMIQLAAPGSEVEARSFAASAQRRFAAQIGGTQPVIREAQVTGGRTVYRVRVGPFSAEDANSRCQQIKAAGGQCFVTRG